MEKILTYKCPSCAAMLNFDSDSQMLVCDSCGMKYDVETIEQMEQDNSENESSYDWSDYRANASEEDMNNCSCPSCGGEIICDANTIATKCPYCGNPTIVTSKVSGMFLPDLVIPFKLNKGEAKKKLTEACKGKPLLPRDFKNGNKIKDIMGVYVPFWLYDCNAHAAINYKATRVHAWSDSKYNYTKTDFYKVYREGDLGFSMVPVDGSTKMDDAYMESLEPFDYSAAVSFETAYLSGYLADKYDVDSEASRPRANERIKKSTESVFASTVQGFATVVPESSSVHINGGTQQYALFPVWLLNTKYGGKIYTFAMNGQTGKFVGEFPVDKKKFWIWLIGLGIGLAAALAVIAALVLK